MNRHQMILGQTYAGGEFEHVGTDKAAAKVGDSLFTLLWGELDEADLQTAERRFAKIKEQVGDVLHAIQFDAYSRAIEPMTQSEAWNWMADNIHMDDALWMRLKEIVQCKPT